MWLESLVRHPEQIKTMQHQHQQLQQWQHGFRGDATLRSLHCGAFCLRCRRRFSAVTADPLFVLLSVFFSCHCPTVICTRFFSAKTRAIDLELKTLRRMVSIRTLQFFYPDSRLWDTSRRCAANAVTEYSYLSTYRQGAMLTHCSEAVC